MKSSTDEYCLSLTGPNTCEAETLIAAREYLDCRDWREVRRRIVQDNMLSLNFESTRKRFGLEIIKRLRNLNDDEIGYYVCSTDDDRHAMTWTMLCRTYPILRNFSCKVLSARYENMIPDLPSTVYDAFAEDEMIEHPKFANIADSSKKQVKFRVFGMMRDCQLIDGDCNITPLYPSDEFVKLLRENSPEDLSLFPKVGALV